MKALIPSGGRGTRLRPITHTNAKQLVPVANKPILFYVLDDIAEAGITDVGIVVGDTGDEIRRAVGDGAAWGLTVTYIAQPDPLGLAHTVLISREFLGHDSFVMYLGDNLLRDGITGIVEDFIAAEPCAQILVTKVPDPQRFGVVELDGERVVRLVEKPKDPPSDLALTGVYLFDESIHDAVRSIAPSDRDELEITDAIQVLVDKGRDVRVHHVQGWWKDTGKPEDLLLANRLVLEGMAARIEGSMDEATAIDGVVVIEDGAVVEASTLRGPLIIGANARVSRASIGPFTAIGADCVVEDAEVDGSIVMDGSVIRGVRRVEASILGREVVVESADAARAPCGYRLMVGDHGRVDVV